MVEALQILLVLVLIALIAIIVGYLVGKLSCKRVQNDYYFQKNDICESKYSENVANIENKFNNKDNSETKDSNIEIIEDKESLTNESSEAETKITVSNSDEKESELNEDTELKKKFENVDVLKEPSDNSKLNSNLISKEDTTHIDEINSSVSSKENGELNSKKNDISVESHKKEKSKISFLSAPLKNKEPDNLCKIKGIGVVIENKLKNIGVYYFDQIAKWTEEEVKLIDKQLAFKGRVLREDWINQAKILASGKDTEFSKRVEKGEVSSSKKS